MNIFTDRAVSELMKALIAKVVAPEIEGVKKVKKVHKQMITSSQVEIDEHNSKVESRQVKRAKVRLDAKLMRV